MAKEKTAIPKGTRDFSPPELARREYIFDNIRSVFRLFGYKPIETPSMENLSTLLGKYGEEGDRLIFRVLNSGDFLSGVPDEIVDNRNIPALAAQICDKGLRYDLTVPFARYVVQNQHQITFPFKRYQIQPVWRADKPQKGRYREFFQCDADVIGSDSLFNEAELIQIIDQVFSRLDLKVEIKINNRKILAGIAQYIGFEDKIIDITTAIDKIEKIGLAKVEQELLQRGLPQQAIDRLRPVLLLKGDAKEKLAELKVILENSPTGIKGIEETEEIFSLTNSFSISCDLELDLTLARGLNYYTGAIIEVKSKEVQIGSICGGGRYDDLTGIFGLPGISGVGVSFGADRIYDVLMALDRFPEELVAFSEILVINFGDTERNYCLPLLQQLRANNISCELYPDAAKMKKQMQYANKNMVPFVLLAGEGEMQQNKFTLKDMHTGEQSLLDSKQIIEKLLKLKKHK